MTGFFIHDAAGNVLRHGVCHTQDISNQAAKGETVALKNSNTPGDIFAYIFDPKTKTFSLSPVIVAPVSRAELIRRKNDKCKYLLAKTDWTQLPDIAVAKRKAWRIYRQALRDITKQPDPATITWPTPPGAI